MPREIDPDRRPAPDTRNRPSRHAGGNRRQKKRSRASGLQNHLDKSRRAAEIPVDLNGGRY